MRICCAPGDKESVSFLERHLGEISLPGLNFEVGPVLQFGEERDNRSDKFLADEATFQAVLGIARS